MRRCLRHAFHDGSLQCVVLRAKLHSARREEWQRDVLVGLMDTLRWALAEVVGMARLHDGQGRLTQLADALAPMRRMERPRPGWQYHDVWLG